MSSLGEEFPKEQARLREMLGHYKEIGPAGTFGALMIEDCLRRADEAAMTQDIIKMVSIYQEMKEFQE